MWGPSIIGFGKSNYKYANGQDGEICMLGFSPRAQALAFYVTTKFKNADSLIKRLGKHKTARGGCWYINKLDDVDLKVLEQILAGAFKHSMKKQQQFELA